MIPVGTDAPLYHRPWGTGGLIVANVAAFVWTAAGLGPAAEAWALHFGQGLRPLEWLTYNFVHFGLDHLVGNMLFLWCFGLIVEGKIGLVRFLTVYLLIGVFGGLWLQTLGWFAASPAMAGGSSVCLFGLLGIALLWAPVNEITLLAFVWWRPFWWDMPVYGVALLYLGLNLYYALGEGFQVGSAVGHLTGAVLGAAVGAYMLRRGWVDCEDWDLFSLLENRKRRRRKEPYEYRVEATRAKLFGHSSRSDSAKTGGAESPTATSSSADDDRSGSDVKPLRVQTVSVQQIRRAIAEGRAVEAFRAYCELQRAGGFPALSEQELWRLAVGLGQAKRWSDAKELLREYIRRFPDGRHHTAACMQLASLCLASKEGDEARRLLQQVDPRQLPKKWVRAYAAMCRRADKLHRRAERRSGRK